MKTLLITLAVLATSLHAGLHGNLISGFGQAAAKGPCVFHNNLVANPGRGVIWINEPDAQLTVRNNHIITRATAKGRADGLFGFNDKCDFGTFRFENNLIECFEKSARCSATTRAESPSWRTTAWPASATPRATRTSQPARPPGWRLR